jgi:hypothetical protein
MKLYLTIAIFLASICAASCQIIRDPVVDYLSRHADAATGKLFRDESWKGRSETEPPGGYLLRFEAPIGVGRAEVTFIASSILADRQSSSWGAYRKVKGKGYTYAGEIGFGAYLRFYLMSPKTNGFLPGSDRRSYRCLLISFFKTQRRRDAESAEGLKRGNQTIG